MSSRKRGAGPKARRSEAKASPGAIVYTDPLINGTIKSQVEDVDLISQRRAQFVETAISLFRHKGYHTTTIREIAKAAGVSAGLIYQYVTDKEDILFLALQHIVHAYRRALPLAMERVQHPLHKFIVAYEEYCRIIEANRDASMLTYMETKTLSPERREAMKQMEIDVNELMARPLRECITEGYIQPMNVDVFVTLASISVHTWAIKHWRLKSVTDIDEYVTFTLDLLLKPFLTDKGRKSYTDYRRNRRG